MKKKSSPTLKPSKNDFLIKNSSYRVLGTGPMCGPILACVNYSDGENNYWLYCCDLDGFLTFNLSNCDITDYISGESDDCYDENGDSNNELYEL